MANLNSGMPVSRRRALTLGGGLAAGLLSPGLRPGTALAGAGPARIAKSAPKLPHRQMQDVLQAEGKLSSGVLQVPIDRDDIQGVTLRGVPIKPAFEINGDLTFQSLAHNDAFFNGDLPLLPGEINRVIDAILVNGLVFQAEHQHFYDFDPPVWFIHFRGRGTPLRLARAVRAVLAATATSLPQKLPAQPTTPLDEKRLKQILRGEGADVGNDGVVTVSVSRRDQIRIAGVPVAQEANIATTVAFQPLDAAGATAAAAPDFAMVASEVDRVVRTMRRAGWDIGCLYNQETDESPQLYFSHQFKTGNPYTLAQEVRRGLDATNSK